LLPVSVWIAGTIIAATLERWWFPDAWDETQLPASRFYFGDARAFLRYAAALSMGQEFDNGVPFHPPGWPVFLSLLFRVAGWSADAPPDPAIFKHVNAMLSGVSVGVAALIAHLVAGRGAMIVTSLLGIFHFGHLIQAAAPNSEPLYGLLVVVVLLLILREDRHSWLPGIVAGLATLVRPEFFLCACLLALWLAVDDTTPSRLARPAFFMLAILLTLLPTTILNWRSIAEFNRTRAERMPGPLPRFAPVTSYGAFNFANANHERATGEFNWNLPGLQPSDDDAARLLEGGQLDLARPPVYEAYVRGYQVGARWLMSHPVDGLRLLANKLAIMQSVFDYGYLIDNVPGVISGTRRPVDQLDLERSWLTLAHLALLLGGVGLALRSRSTRLLLAPLATLLISSSLFFGYVRLGVAYLPVVWIVQALAVTQLLRLVGAGPTWPRRAEHAAAALVAIMLLVEASRVSQQRTLRLDGVVDDAGYLVEDQAVIIDRVKD
jgi:hypothetical protein